MLSRFTRRTNASAYKCTITTKSVTPSVRMPTSSFPLDLYYQSIIGEGSFDSEHVRCRVVDCTNLINSPGPMDKRLIYSSGLYTGTRIVLPRTTRKQRGLNLGEHHNGIYHLGLFQFLATISKRANANTPRGDFCCCGFTNLRLR